jgi:hypothetical protein
MLRVYLKDGDMHKVNDFVIECVVDVALNDTNVCTGKSQAVRLYRLQAISIIGHQKHILLFTKLHLFDFLACR